MENKNLIAYIRKGNKSIYSPEEQYDYSERIVQRLLEYEELRKLVSEVVDPIIELCKYSGKIPNFQKGDINYGRKE